jgi:two-component system NtrC family response regulator
VAAEELSRMADEDSPQHFAASIEPEGRWAARVARACVDAVTAKPAGALEVVLRHVRDAAGAERAFLLEAMPPAGRARVIAASDRRSKAAAFSTRIAARALRGERPLFLADLRRDAQFADGASVRELALRSALAAPVPDASGRRTAVVLDSREPLDVGPDDGCELVRAFSPLVALVRRGAPETTPATRSPRRAPVGGSRAFLKLQDEVKAAARVPLPALIVGESGSGKELVARALHDGGARAARPFVAVNCAAIPESLLERELFGATRGAYTGADKDHPGLFRQADGGTVFLDEIGDMPPSLQAKLLRVLQEGTVRAVGALEERPLDVRVVAATHRDLATLVDENRFRADLRWRLEVLVLRVPALRHRLDDLPAISASLLDHLAARCGVPPVRLDATALERLVAHAWPGNIRELESALARAMLRARDGTIRVDDLDLGTAAPSAPSGPASLERAMIESALCETRGNVTAAAARIGWSRQALYRRIHALGLLEAQAPSEDAGGTKSSLSSTFQ